MIEPVQLSRRRLLQRGGASWLALQSSSPWALAADANADGLVIGQTEGAAVGRRILREGGNAVDAAVAAALVAGVVAVPMCGIGGYGGHLVVGWPDGRVAAIDFNSAAPAAAHERMFPLDAKNRVRGGVNQYGWLSAGVPGTLAGLQLAIDRFGTRKLDELIGPAIGFARDGFPVSKGLASAIVRAQSEFSRDPGSAKLFLSGGRPLAAGERFRNPDLAALLEKLASDNSVDSFYRGSIAARIAGEFKKHDGLVTAADLAGYQARQVDPLAFTWRDRTIYTPPLTAGGLSVLQTLATLKSLAWENTDPTDPRSAHARIEATRIAWQDRLALLGDPMAADVPVERLLSAKYADESARRVRDAVRAGQMIPAASDGRPSGGTVHLSASDKDGMMVAVTITHGGGFGARVTVDGLGLVLGHGMSRFEPTPGHPNSPWSRARPLNNMCPSLVFAEGRPVAAMGATGGRLIPNSLCDVLAHFVGRDMSLVAAAAVPRLHTEGDAMLRLAKGWNPATVSYLKNIGYRIEDGAGANLNGMARDAATGALISVP